MVSGSCQRRVPDTQEPMPIMTHKAMTRPIPRSKAGRIAWSFLRHPVKSREFPAKHERLVTSDELRRFEPSLSFR